MAARSRDPGRRLGPASSLGRLRDLTCGPRAREARTVPCDDGVHTSAQPVQRLDAPEATEDPPHASECPSALGERAVSAVGALVRVDPPHSLGDRLAREPHRRRIIDELPRHHADPGWKASAGEVRGPRAEPTIPVEDQGRLLVTRVRRRLLHNPMVSVGRSGAGALGEAVWLWQSGHSYTRKRTRLPRLAHVGVRRQVGIVRWSAAT
jgi:hypothetical protein